MEILNSKNSSCFFIYLLSVGWHLLALVYSRIDYLSAFSLLPYSVLEMYCSYFILYVFPLTIPMDKSNIIKNYNFVTHIPSSNFLFSNLAESTKSFQKVSSDVYGK